MKSLELITNATFFQEPMVKVLNYAMITALAAGIAALPFFSLKHFRHFFGQVQRFSW
mgnify:CR=1 FL=1|tara:strand:+ start:1131 stop:1301 length:171 start_codon:yes stop_codon:yes gene_type:complete